jgi:hypothetical protein
MAATHEQKMGPNAQIEDRSAGSYRSCLHRILSPDPSHLTLFI